MKLADEHFKDFIQLGRQIRLFPVHQTPKTIQKAHVACFFLRLWCGDSPLAWHSSCLLPPVQVPSSAIFTSRVGGFPSWAFPSIFLKI